MVAIFRAEKLKLFLERFVPNLSPKNASCHVLGMLCSDLRYHRGAGRHLAGHLHEIHHELPQV